MDVGVYEILSAVAGCAFMILGIIGWVRKKTILNTYKGVFGRISSLIVAFCTVGPVMAIISGLIGEQEISFLNIVLSLLIYWSVAAAIYIFFIKKKCPSEEQKGLFINVLLCGTATILQIALCFFVVIWFIYTYLTREKEEYVEYNGEIYKVKRKY